MVDVGRLGACGDEVPRVVLQHRRCGATLERWRQAGVDRTQHPISLRVSPCGPSSTRSAPTRGRRLVKRAQELFAEGCPKTSKPPRQSRRDKGTKRSSTTKASAEIGWLARRRNIVTAATTKLPKTHNLVGAGHVGAALPGTQNVVGGRACGSRQVAAGSWARAAEVLGQSAARTTTATGRGGLPGQLIA